MTAALPTDVAVLWVDYVGSDWLGIYVDGDRVYEGHPPAMEDVLHLLGIEVAEATFPSDRLANLRRSRGLPRRFPRETPW